MKRYIVKQTLINICNWSLRGQKKKNKKKQKKKKIKICPKTEPNFAFLENPFLFFLNFANIVQNRNTFFFQNMSEYF